MSFSYKKTVAYAPAVTEKTQFAPLGKIDLTDTVNASASNIVVYGRSVAINQLIDFSLVRDYVNQTYPAHIISGIDIRAYDIDPVSQLSNCVVLNGTASADVEIFLLNSETQFNRIPGHYYFLTGNNNSEMSDSCYMILGNERDSDVLIDKGNPGDSGIHDEQIKVYEKSGNVQSLYIKVLSGTTLNEVIFRPQLIDLTQLFGYDQNGSPYGALSYGEIRSLISSDYYSYNPGKIVGVESITIKSTADVGGETSSVQATISTVNGIGLYPISDISDVNNGLFDVLDLKNKQHTKAVDSVNVGGDSFSEITIDIDTYFQSSSSAADAGDGSYCLSSDGTECIVQGGKFCFKASSNIYPSLNQWNEHVARLSQVGCPLTVVYKKATPETVSVQNGLPTIKTYRGGTTVSVYTNDFSNPDAGYPYAGQDGGIAFSITYPLQESGSSNVSYKSKIYATLGTPTTVSGNGTFVTDSAGVPVKDYSVKGTTIVWNQMVQNPDFSNTVVDTETYVFFRVQQLASPYESFLGEELQEPGLVSAIFTITASGDCRIKHNGDVNDIDFCYFTSVKDHKYYICFNFTSTNPTVAGGVAYNKAQLFDLTKMFGAGNEPATPAEFQAMFPDDYYSYNVGELKSIEPTSVETKNQSGETKYVNIPSSKYFPDGMKSAGSAYDEINFLSQKAIKRIGVRAYQTGDENNAAVMTDKKNTVYELATPVETAITPPLQALSTFKGFTSFSAPNSLTQNGPLSVTYYAEGGANPESGWLTSYKRKLYMGRNIEWNQLLDKSKFEATKTIDGVNIKNNGDGTYTLNGTYIASGTGWVAFYNDNDLSIAKRLYGHKVLYGCKLSVNSELENNSCGMSYEINGASANGTGFYYNDSCVISQTLNKVSPSDITRSIFYIVLLAPSSGAAVYKDAIIRPQLFDLTQMFGAGNEPATPEEFWSYFDHKLYPYNPGETQPLFKISRKSITGRGV